MYKSLLKRVIRGIIPFIIFFGTWIFLTEVYEIKPVFLPTIPHVFVALRTLFWEENYTIDMFVSIYRVMAAFTISAVLAIPLGLFTGYSRRIAEVVEPFIGFVRYLPVAAFVPLCILWFGLGHNSKIAVIFLGTFFQLILMVADVARQVPISLFEAALTLGATRKHLVVRVLLPASLPGIVNACRIAVGWAWTYLVVAEIAGATSGLGFRIIEAQRYVKTPNVFAGIVVIGLLGVIIDLLFRSLHKLMFPWLES